MNILRMNAEVYLHITEWCFNAQIKKKKLCVTVANCCFAFYQVSLQEPQVS